MFVSIQYPAYPRAEDRVRDPLIRSLNFSVYLVVLVLATGEGKGRQGGRKALDPMHLVCQYAYRRPVLDLPCIVFINIVGAAALGLPHCCLYFARCFT